MIGRTNTCSRRSPSNAYTIRVGLVESKAKANLYAHNDVLDLLTRLVGAESVDRKSLIVSRADWPRGFLSYAECRARICIKAT